MQFCRVLAISPGIFKVKSSRFDSQETSPFHIREQGIKYNDMVIVDILTLNSNVPIAAFDGGIALSCRHAQNQVILPSSVAVESQERGDRTQILTGYTGRMFIILSFGAMIARLSRRVLPPLLPGIIDDLAISPVEAGVILTVTTVFFGAMQFPGGRISDRLTRQTVLLTGLGTLMVGGALLAIAPTYIFVLLGAAVIGAGEGLYGPADRAFLSDIYREARGRVFGLHMVSLELAGILAAGLATLVIAAWRTAYVPIGLSLGIVWFFLYRISRESFELAVVPLDATSTIKRLFTTPRFRGVIGVYCLFAFTSQGIVGFLPTLLHAERGFSTAFASGMFAILFAIGVVARPVGGWLSDRWPRLVVGSVGLLVGSCGIAVIILSSSAVYIMIGVMLFAGGQKAFPPAIQAYLMDIFPDSSMGGDLGAARTVYIGAGSLGPTFVGIMASTVNYTAAFIGLLFSFLLGGGLMLRMVRRY